MHKAQDIQVLYALHSKIQISIIHAMWKGMHPCHEAKAFPKVDYRLILNPLPRI